MLNATATATAIPARRNVSRRATVPCDAACQAFAALGDAVALINRTSGRLDWASDAWRSLVPDAALGAGADALERAMPGLRSACAECLGGAARHRTSLGERQRWDAELAAIDDRHLLLRLTDRRELGRAVQRQLDDREQLLFTSRVISVGEMATTLAHELNQPIGATANLLRGLRTRLNRRRPALNEEEAAALERALEQVMFAARIIARIREFTLSHQPRHTRLDLAALLRASASLLDWDLRRSRAALVLELPDSAVPVRGDAPTDKV